MRPQMRTYRRGQPPPDLHAASMRRPLSASHALRQAPGRPSGGQPAQTTSERGITTMSRTITVLGVLAASTALAGGAAGYASAGPTTSAATSEHSARQAPTAHLDLTASSAALAACFPHAKAQVNVKLTTDEIGKDTFQIRASGLQPKTDFTVFLIEKAGAPF